MPLVLICALAALPVLLTLVFRVNAVMVFLAVATGSLLERAVGDSLALVLNMAIRNGSVDYIAHIGLLILPSLLTLFFLRKSAKHALFLLQLLPLVAACLALTVLLLPLLPADFQTQVYAQEPGKIARQSSDVIVAVAATLNLLLAWRIYAHKDGHGKHH